MLSFACPIPCSTICILGSVATADFIELVRSVQRAFSLFHHLLSPDDVPTISWQVHGKENRDDGHGVNFGGVSLESDGSIPGSYYKVWHMVSDT